MFRDQGEAKPQDGDDIESLPAQQYQAKYNSFFHDDHEVKAIDTGSICLESLPCQHNVTLTYTDGQEEKLMMYGSDIAKNYWQLLKNDRFGEDHFAFYRESKRATGNRNAFFTTANNDEFNDISLMDKNSHRSDDEDVAKPAGCCVIL